jgi:hypothetical protein
MKLIKLKEDHYIIVDDSEIKEGDYFLCWETINDIPSNIEIDQATQSNIHPFINVAENYKKITHSTQPLEEDITYRGITSKPALIFFNIKTLSLSEVEELIYGYSLENMYKKPTKVDDNTKTGEAFLDGHFYGFEEGVETYQELVKDKLFTIEDMKRIFEKGYSAGRSELSSKESDKIKYDYIHSLLPKTEWDVDFDEQDKLKLI